MYVCICAAVTKRQVERELRKGADFHDLQSNLCVARQCCLCAETIHKMIVAHDKYPHGTPSTG